MISSFIIAGVTVDLLQLRPLLVEEAQYFPSSLFASGFFMSQDTECGRQKNVTELTTGEQIHNPFLDFAIFDVEARGNNTTLVEASGQFNDNLAGSVIVDDLEFTNVSWCSMIVRRKKTSIANFRECDDHMLCKTHSLGKQHPKMGCNCRVLVQQP
jgi:hypothetical protein